MAIILKPEKGRSGPYSCPLCGQSGYKTKDRVITQQQSEECQAYADQWETSRIPAGRKIPSRQEATEEELLRPNRWLKAVEDKKKKGKTQVSSSEDDENKTEDGRTESPPMKKHHDGPPPPPGGAAGAQSMAA